MALTFEYEVGGTTYSTTLKTLTPGPLEDDEREATLYDPRAPAHATTLDHLPGKPKVTATGELEARPGPAIHLLVLPVLFVGLGTSRPRRPSPRGSSLLCSGFWPQPEPSFSTSTSTAVAPSATAMLPVRLREQHRSVGAAARPSS
jgi:hypothetical protein